MRDKNRPVFGFNPTDTNPADVTAAILEPPDRVRLVVTPNVDHVARLRRSGAFRDAYRAADMVLCDGFPVALYAWLHARVTHRVTGCDVVRALMDRKRVFPRAGRLFFAVDSEATAAAVRGWAWATGLGDRVATAVPPPGFAARATDREVLADAIRAHRTTLLVMGVGAPQSEVFVDRMRASLPPAWAICVGQAVKAELGLVRRAPSLARSVGLEWLWRVIQEPNRLGRRYALGALDFALAVTEDILDHGRTLGPEL